MNFRTQTGAPVYTTAQIRQLETLALCGLQPPGLMERAGFAAAELARSLSTGVGRILVLAGPGNNGGDAFVVARYLKTWWFNVDVVFTGDAARLPPDARAACAAWRDCGGENLKQIPSGRQWDLLVDGLFGIGLQRDLAEPYAGMVAAINDMDARVLALDVPSGLDSDTGSVRGCAVRADHTATFVALKPGLLTLDGPDCCGEIHVCPLGLKPAALAAPPGAVTGSDILQSALPARRANSHKGDYGSVGIIGGACGMTGAALLAGRAALQLGTGRVYVGLLDANGPTVDQLQPELMLRRVDEVLALDHLTCLTAGPGLGQSPTALQSLQAVVNRPQALVLDADALNLLAGDAALRRAVCARATPALLTPHPAEAARLLNCTTAVVQSDRIAAATELATQYNCHIVLKGAGSICALADGRWFVNTSGNPGMASAGMGDVLTGMISALIAQRADAQTALLAGVHLHGAAADNLVADGHGPVGMTASDVITAARRLLNAHSGKSSCH